MMLSLPVPDALLRVAKSVTFWVASAALGVGLVSGGVGVGCLPQKAPTISLPASVSAQPGRMVDIAATTNGSSVEWTATAADYDVKVSGTSSVWVFPSAGQYTVTARTALSSQIASANCAVTVGDVPPPGPGPAPPVPPNPPGPAVKLAWVVMVKDNAVMTPAVAAIENSATLWSGLKSKGIGWRIYDVAAPAVKDKGYDQLATTAGGAPVLLLLAADGTVIKAAKLPADEAGVNQLIAAAMGGKP